MHETIKAMKEDVHEAEDKLRRMILDTDSNLDKFKRDTAKKAAFMAQQGNIKDMKKKVFSSKQEITYLYFVYLQPPHGSWIIGEKPQLHATRFQILYR